MDREQTKQIIGAMMGAYPSFNPQNVGLMVDTWTSCLGEYSFEQISYALKAYITTNTTGFPPSIGQLIGILADHANRNQMNESEAWNLVYKAICKSNYGAQEEFEKLPQTVQRAVGTFHQLRAWAGDSDFNEGVESSNFKRAYRQAIEREKYESKIPQNLLNSLNNVSNNLMIGEKNNDEF